MGKIGIESTTWVPREPRDSGILAHEDNKIAQELFDHVLAEGGLIKQKDEAGVQTTVTVTTYEGWRKRSMRLQREREGVGQLTLNLRRGKDVWHDDGASGSADTFVEGSGVE